MLVAEFQVPVLRATKDLDGLGTWCGSLWSIGWACRMTPWAWRWLWWLVATTRTPASETVNARMVVLASRAPVIHVVIDCP